MKARVQQKLPVVAAGLADACSCTCSLQLASASGPCAGRWAQTISRCNQPVVPANEGCVAAAAAALLQVPVIQLLGHLWGHLLAADAAASASAAAAAASAGGRISGSGGGSAYDMPESSSGSIAAALPGILAYLSNALSSLNPAVKLEAARVLLRVSKASGSGTSAAGGDGLLSRMRLVGSVPPATAAAAIEVRWGL
jgi:hypothetical protein